MHFRPLSEKPALQRALRRNRLHVTETVSWHDREKTGSDPPSRIREQSRPARQRRRGRRRASIRLRHVRRCAHTESGCGQRACGQSPFGCRTSVRRALPPRRAANAGSRTRALMRQKIGLGSTRCPIGPRREARRDLDRRSPRGLCGQPASGSHSPARPFRASRFGDRLRFYERPNRTPFVSHCSRADGIERPRNAIERHGRQNSHCP